MPIHEISECKFAKTIGSTMEARAYAELVDESVGVAWYETDDLSAVGVVLCDPSGDAISYGWEAYCGTKCIGHGFDLQEEDAALVQCVKRMLGVG